MAYYLSETKRLDSGAIARRYQIIGTNIIVCDVWEPTSRTSERELYGHSTITTFGDAWYGRVGTRNLPADLARLPYGDERIIRVTQWQEAEAEIAYAVIREAFPDIPVNNRKRAGEIEYINTVNLDAITKRHSGFDCFEDMLNADGGYRPTIRIDGRFKAELKVLADAYDNAQETRGDARRAYRG